MNMKLLEKICNRIELSLIVIWECLLIFRMINLYSLLPSKLDTIIFSLISILGIIILTKNSIEWIYKRRKYDVFLIIFILAALISSVFFGSGIIIGNMKIIFWQILLIFVIYENGKTGKYFSIIENILIHAWFILVLISIVLFFSKISMTIPLSKLYYGIRFGFVENRLFGVFVDPNYAATISVVVVLISLSMFKKGKNVPTKIFLLANTILQLLYISLSGSRTALVEIIVAVFFGIFFILLKGKHKIKNIIKSIGVSLISVLVIVVIINLTQTLSLKIVNSYNTPIGIQNYITAINNPSESNKKNNIVVENDKSIDLERKDVKNNNDISNNRFRLWKSAFEIFKETPVLGTSPRGLIPFAQRELPETLIGKNGQSPHNFFFYSLASIGLLGTIPLVLFFLYNITRTIINLWGAHNIYNYDFLIRVLVTLILLISGSLLPDLIFFNKLGAFLFWLYFGNIVSQNKRIKLARNRR